MTASAALSAPRACRMRSDADKRKEQAKTAYTLKGDISRDKYYILVDDV